MVLEWVGKCAVGCRITKKRRAVIIFIILEVGKRGAVGSRNVRDA